MRTRTGDSSARRGTRFMPWSGIEDIGLGAAWSLSMMVASIRSGRRASLGTGARNTRKADRSAENAAIGIDGQTLTMSLGVATYPWEGQDKETLIDEARRAGCGQAPGA
jgi:hypothetical protein